MRMLGGRRHDDSPRDRRCRMCGTTVEVDADGRCPLGHPVQTAASTPVEQLPPAPPPVEQLPPVPPPVEQLPPAPPPVEQLPPAPPPAVPAPADAHAAPPAVPAPVDVPAVPSLTLPAPPVVAPVAHEPGDAVDHELAHLDEPPAAPADEASRRRLVTMLGGGGVALLAGLAAAVAMAL